MVRAAVISGALTMVLSLASLGVHLIRIGRWQFAWHEIAISQIVPEYGYAFQAPNDHPELSAHQRPSPAALLENGVPLGPPNAQHADIRSLGRGRFSIWHQYVYFSSSDLSDPRTNGRRYTIRYPPIDYASASVLYVLTAASALYFSITASFAIGARIWLLLPWARTRGVAVTKAVVRTLRAVVISGALTMVLSLASLGVHLTRIGWWQFVWHETAISQIVPEHGYAFQAPNDNPTLSAHERPSPATVLENGVPLGPSNAQHADTRSLGRGRFSIWNQYIYSRHRTCQILASDPRANGRRYTIRYPPLDHWAGIVLYFVTVVSFSMTTGIWLLLAFG